MIAFKNLYNGVHKLATRPRILILFLLAHAVLLLMMLFTFPEINAKMQGRAFDLRTFGYTYEEALVLVRNLDDLTTEKYIFPQLLLLDVLYPMLVALFLSALILRLMDLLKVASGSLYSNLYLIPFLAMLFDYLENASIVVMISNPDSLSEQLVGLASSLTLLKSSFTILSWIIVLTLSAFWLIARTRKK